MACSHVYAATPEKPTNDRCVVTPTSWYAYRHLYLELCDVHRDQMEDTMRRQTELSSLPDDDPDKQDPHPLGTASLIPIEAPPAPWGQE